MTDTKEQVRTFVRTNFYVPEAAKLADDASLLAQGIIDSTGVLELVGFMEDSFDIRVEDSEMVPQNLDSVDSISSFIDRKKA